MINRIEDIALDCIVETINDSEYWVFNSAEFTKFSQLIIHECAELVAGYYDERTMQWAGPTIKEHFGIE